ncbi:CYTH domain-containing protein [Robiginitalea sp. M366]|uniref:CYTH domain-containing protein n=1 Tax=Robiginitalea aestuariiviva TaxID=3036903 RepID=UPI00240D9BC6|nr:CYTH domain-containing protein [Robiginitalea aestuariiviva]MDG1571613.1 CYTH domain-containing protein [Robiginitalea aestuariiviva]
MIEIERKFLVRDRSYRKEAARHWAMVQGFLSTDPERVVRVRRSGSEAWITIKGKTVDGGTTREEWEFEIPPEAAERLLQLCLPVVIRKIRYEVVYGGHTFEVDEFQDDNQGLTLAEIELTDVAEAFDRPGWLGEEVTGRPEYYNSQLSKKPYATWK